MKRALWWLGLALLAVLATCAQFDRASERTPALALAVPAPLRSAAQVPVTVRALAGSDPATARAEAARLVRRRPMPAEHLFLLALADLRAGDTAGYGEAFVRASERGWRARPVQQAAARAALARGEVDAAANRVAALWAVDSSDPAIPELTRELLAAQGGPAAFAAKLAGTDVWQNLYLQRAEEFTAPAVISSIVLQAEQQGARFDCAMVAALSSRVGSHYPRRASSSCR